MRITFLFLILSTISWGQAENSGNLLVKEAPCTFEMTVEQLLSDELNFHCSKKDNDDKSFKIENFKIKIPNHATIFVKGKILNEESEILAKSLKTGDYVTIFEIENIVSQEGKPHDYKTLMIKIVE